MTTDGQPTKAIIVNLDVVLCPWSDAEPHVDQAIYIGSTIENYQAALYVDIRSHPSIDVERLEALAKSHGL